MSRCLYCDSGELIERIRAICEEINDESRRGFEGQQAYIKEELEKLNSGKRRRTGKTGNADRIGLESELIRRESLQSWKAARFSEIASLLNIDT